MNESNQYQHIYNIPYTYMFVINLIYFKTIPTYSYMKTNKRYMTSYYKINIYYRVYLHTFFISMLKYEVEVAMLNI